MEAGADDYVTKPFHIREITARIRALRRRVGSTADDGVYHLNVVIDSHGGLPLVLSPKSGTIRRGDDELHLTLTEFRVLSELARVPVASSARRALLETVWDHGFFGDERIVDVHVRRLRTKIELDPAKPRLVITVRGLGYRLDIR